VIHRVRELIDRVRDIEICELIDHLNGLERLRGDELLK
jgi:hypothetical protein